MSNQLKPAPEINLTPELSLRQRKYRKIWQRLNQHRLGLPLSRACQGSATFTLSLTNPTESNLLSRTFQRLSMFTLAALGIIMLLVAAACGGGASDSAESATADSDEAYAPADEWTVATMYDQTAAESEEAASLPSPPATTTIVIDDTGDGSGLAETATSGSGIAVTEGLTPADLGRDIIYTAEMTVEFKDVEEATRQAINIVTNNGGIVFGQRTRTVPHDQSDLTFKVLPSDFSNILEQLASIGDLISQTVSSDDVTEQIVDIQSRIITAEESVSRLRKFLSDASTVDQVSSLEHELLNRETTLETLRGQLRTLQDQVALATITLSVRQSPEVLPEAEMRVNLWGASGSDDPCLGSDYLTTEADSTVRLCLEVGNWGDASLTNLTVRSEPVRLDTNSFELLEGTFDQIESNRQLVAKLDLEMSDGRLAGRVATRGLPISVTVTATPVNNNGRPLREISHTSEVFVDVSEDDSLPGFRDAIGDALTVLSAVVGVVLVVMGWLVPLLLFVGVPALIIWWLVLRIRTHLIPLISHLIRRNKRQTEPQASDTTPPQDETKLE